MTSPVVYSARIWLVGGASRARGRPFSNERGGDGSGWKGVVSDDGCVAGVVRAFNTEEVVWAVGGAVGGARGGAAFCFFPSGDVSRVAVPIAGCVLTAVVGGCEMWVHEIAVVEGERGGVGVYELSAKWAGVGGWRGAVWSWALEMGLAEVAGL
eukprot:3848553-Rhodomonas_salina.2